MKLGIITGASRGIGMAIAKLISETMGAQVLGTSTTGKHVLCNPDFSGYPLDLSSSDSISEFIDKISGINVDFLINNAGILLEQWDEPQVDIQQLKDTFDVNLFGTVELTEKLLPLLRDNGQIINITSGWGSFSEKNFDEFQPHYKMSKAALNMYTKLLAKRLEWRKITVSSFDPGWVKTDMGGEYASRTPEDVAWEIKEMLCSPPESGYFWHNRTIMEW